MKKYNVVIHYEGGYLFEVEAEDEDQAAEIAQAEFDNLSNYDLAVNLADIFVDAVWEK